MSLRLNGSSSGYSELTAPAVAGDQTFTLPGAGGVLDRLERAGNILQVVQTAYTSADSTTAAGPSSFASTGCTASITPSSSSNKVLAMLSMATYHGSSAMLIGARIMRGSSAAFSGITLDFWTASGSGLSGNINIQWLDSPSTASSITYTAQFSTWGGGTAFINKDYNNNNNGVTYLTLLEVAA